ncbi:MAG TPA: tetratricopeptide repeat protein [Anaeromyxobacter sp.]|nr:tetratricopeptide repeat protein [Anaeromyxobacter sp.]
MSWPGRRRPFNRSEELAAADLNRARGRRRRAIAGYRRVLEADPEDLTVHARIAPLLAAAGDREEALKSFRTAADGQSRAGFHERALSLFIQAAEHFPDEESLWPEIARLHLQRGRRAEAVAALTAGGWRLYLARQYAVAERVLLLALQFDPHDADAVAILARVLSRAGRRAEAVRLLEGIAARVQGRRLAAVRGILFRVHPTLEHLWGWTRALLDRA